MAVTRAIHLLLSNHPRATKLLSTVSACDFVMLAFGLIALTSRSAARDETEYASVGADMMSSTYEGHQSDSDSEGWTLIIYTTALK
jgi:hypothetical protein